MSIPWLYAESSSRAKKCWPRGAAVRALNEKAPNLRASGGRGAAVNAGLPEAQERLVGIQETRARHLGVGGHIMPRGKNLNL